MTRVILLLLCFLTSCSLGNALTEGTHFITTGTTAVQNGIYEIQSTCLVGGTATDVFIYTRGNTTINNAKLAFVPINEDKTYTAPATVDIYETSQKCDFLYGDKHHYNNVTMTCENHPAVGKIALTPGSYTPTPGHSVSTATQLKNATITGFDYGGTFCRSNGNCRVSDGSASSITRYASTPALSYTLTYTRLGYNLAVTFKSSMKSCVYGSCTLINSTVA